MPLGRPLTPLALTDEIHQQLESYRNSRSLPHGLVRRAEIILLAADGWPNDAISASVGLSRATVGKWRDPRSTNGRTPKALQDNGRRNQEFLHFLRHSMP